MPSIITRSVWNLRQAGGICEAPGWWLVGTLSKCPTDDAPDFEIVMAWLQEKMPGESGKVSIIHNDYRFDNVVLDPHEPLKIIGRPGLGNGDHRRSADGSGRSAGLLGGPG